jgi:hypothetical protein
LIEHADGKVAGCTLGVKACRGRELPHEGDPVRCWVWTRKGCAYCGVQQTVSRRARGQGYAPFAVKDAG